MSNHLYGIVGSFVLGLGGLPLSSCDAQALIAAILGSRVRVQSTTVPRWRVGRLDAMDSTTIVLRRVSTGSQCQLNVEACRATTESLPFESLRAFEMSQGKAGGRVLLGSVVGGSLV